MTTSTERADWHMRTAEKQIAEADEISTRAADPRKGNLAAQATAHATLALYWQREVEQGR